MHRKLLSSWGSHNTLFKKVLRWLEEKYSIKGVTISPYNLKANRAIERPYWDVWQILYKATNGDVSKWYWFLYHVM